jgi:adenine-specific DNA-methyltransferase
LAFRRQVPIGPYIVDFFYPAKALIVEIDGSQHFTDEGLAADMARTQGLRDRGYRILRFSNADVIENMDGVGDRILDATGS